MQITLSIKHMYRFQLVNIFTLICIIINNPISSTFGLRQQNIDFLLQSTYAMFEITIYIITEIRLIHVKHMLFQVFVENYANQSSLRTQLIKSWNLSTHLSKSIIPMSDMVHQTYPRKCKYICRCLKMMMQIGETTCIQILQIGVIHSSGHIPMNIPFIL